MTQIRTFCMMYGIILIFEGSVSLADHPGVACGFGHCPLPCQRNLWEPHATNSEWIQRYKRFLASTELFPLSSSSSASSSSSSSTVHLLKINDLVASVHQSPEAIYQSTSFPANAVAKWCDELDEFGMLVWMATMSALNPD